MLILSGSPIIGSFDYRARVDFVRVPGVIKLRNGVDPQAWLTATTSRIADHKITRLVELMPWSYAQH